MTLLVEHHPTEHWTVLHVSGDVDFNSASDLKKEIVTAISQGHTQIALNLAQVPFLDSTGLAVLVSGAKRAKENGGNLVLLRPNEQIRRILNITDLIKVLPVHDSAQELAKI